MVFGAKITRAGPPAAGRACTTISLPSSKVRVPRSTFSTGSGGSAGLRAQAKAEDAPAPEFKEVYDLIRAHLAGMSEAQLNQAAVGALVSGLASRVSLVTN